MASRRSEFAAHQDAAEGNTDRRVVRQELHELKESMEAKENDLAVPNNVEFKRMIEAQKIIQPRITHAREAHLDAQIAVKTADIALKQATNLVIGKRIAPNQVEDAIIAKYALNVADRRRQQKQMSQSKRGGGASSSSAAVEADDDDEMADVGASIPVDWTAFGRDSRKFFLTAPRLQFLYGPLEVQPKERKAPVQKEKRARVVAEGPVARPDEDGGAASDINQQQETLVLMTAMKKRLDGLTTEYNRKIDETWRKDVNKPAKNALKLFDVVLDPKSYCHTVENIFYLSFLVQAGNAAIHVVGDEAFTNIAAAGKEKEQANENAAALEKSQFIMALDYDRWEQLCKSYVPPRPEEMENARPKAPAGSSRNVQPQPQRKQSEIPFGAGSAAPSSSEKKKRPRSKPSQDDDEDE